VGQRKRVGVGDDRATVDCRVSAEGAIRDRCLRAEFEEGAAVSGRCLVVAEGAGVDDDRSTGENAGAAPAAAQRLIGSNRAAGERERASFVVNRSPVRSPMAGQDAGGQREAALIENRPAGLASRSAIGQGEAGQLKRCAGRNAQDAAG